LVADASGRSIAAYELASRIRTASVDLDFAPSRFDLVSGTSLFLLSAGSATDPLQVLDAARLAVYFIPLPAAPVEPAQEN